MNYKTIPEMFFSVIEEQKNNNVFNYKSNGAWKSLLGNEVKGVQQDVVSESDTCIEIPQYGTKHSLNISVTCGVVLWDLFKKNS